MQLTFGLHLDDLTLPRIEVPTGGSVICGPRGLLSILETHLGLTGHPDNIDYLRIEQYRQAMISWQSSVGSPQSAVRSLQSAVPSSESTDQSEELHGNIHSPFTIHNSPFYLPPFYQKSFEADPFATAAELLSRRDELLLSGWDFSVQSDTPPRLKTLAEVEAIFHENPIEGEEALSLSPGFADRFCLVLEKIKMQGHPFIQVLVNEPLELLPFHFQRLFDLIGKTAACPTIEPAISPKNKNETQARGVTDLEKFQHRITGQTTEKQTLAADGTLLLLRAKRSNEAAAYLAQLLRLNPDFRPACLIPEKNRTLDMALVKEGLPSLGILSASLARPALQILKLAPTFLWQPIDPFKILEFVSLAIKPLPDELATEIARQVAQTPGLQGERWYAMTNRYFSELEDREPPAVVAEQRKQYDFWFERQRYRIDRTVPKRDVVQVYDYLREWAYKVFEENGNKNHSLLVLSEQAKRIVELLQALPETELGYLPLERIVRTIYEPSPITFQEREVGHLPFAMHPSAFIGEVEETVWWDFVQNEPPHFFSRWYPNERAFLKKQNIHPDTPEQENARMLWQRTCPVLLTKKRLLFVVPEVVDGEATLSHPLLGDLEAAFGDLEKITADISSDQPSVLHDFFKLPHWEMAGQRLLGSPKPFLQVEGIDQVNREYETLTSLESLFYYPYQWFFRYKIKLVKSAILSVVKDNALMGNLAHRVFERLMKLEGIFDWDKPALDAWIETETSKLLVREGAVLLMYGREPERIAFVNKLKYAAWSLVSHIKDNGWRVVDTEKELSGQFPVSSSQSAVGGQVDVKGIADLVLERNGELAVIDLKWRGAAYRANVLKNGEDLQLVLYSRLLAGEGQWAHTAYFIIENGKMVARNNLAFKNIVPLVPDSDFTEINQRILNSMEATWHWRMAQLANGSIEIRTRQTLQEIEGHYGETEGELMYDILEMKSEDARWDDYRTLINLVE